ncbi:segregation and condensation protein A [Liquorilactobacillus satsumensis]|uniref:segregation and condensation protein A n=1 Tax=Liquorilactobacillus satsumensis TaxID=259059 RepID=UPI0021C2C37C|nr:segregation/condensation protein A [Liquorilactobacillus satsumensis]MCP9327824.1 segregation/condensation protein A [Liquorilactobacillus satsumensis]
MASEDVQTQLTFKLDTFEGPLDLLLQLIKKNEMDIYDIQMTKITSQYIEQLHQMQTMSLDIAGEYLVMAATLLNIKSKMLLPQHPAIMDTQESQDPRLELVQQLLLHQCYQLAASNLEAAAQKRARQHTREQAAMPAGVRSQLLKKKQAPEKLQHALFSLLSRQQIKVVVNKKVHREHYTIKGEMQRLQQLLATGPTVELEFSALFEKQQEIKLDQVVTSFLALLELIKRGIVQAKQKSVLGPIKLRSVAKNAE